MEKLYSVITEMYKDNIPVWKNKNSETPEGTEEYGKRAFNYIKTGSSKIVKETTQSFPEQGYRWASSMYKQDFVREHELNYSDEVGELEEDHTRLQSVFDLIEMDNTLFCENYLKLDLTDRVSLVKLLEKANNMVKQHGYKGAGKELSVILDAEISIE